MGERRWTSNDPEAWEAFMEAERRELRLRKDGALAKLIALPLPGDDRAALERMAEEDRLKAEEDLVELRSPEGEVSYKHIDDLTEEDRAGRIEAMRVFHEWLAERIGRLKKPGGPFGSNP